MRTKERPPVEFSTGARDCPKTLRDFLTNVCSLLRT